MGLFEHFPYTNFHELNLDWITKFVKSVRDRLDLIDAAVKAAQDARDESEEFSLESEAWAVGTKNGEAVPADAPQHENNSKYWAEQAANSASAADGYADDAKGYADDAQGYANDAAASAADTTQADAAKAWAEEAEAWAVGTKDGSPVASDADQYENNSKYWAEQAADSATNAGSAAAAAVGDAELYGVTNVTRCIAYGVVVKAARDIYNSGSLALSLNIPGLVCVTFPFKDTGSTTPLFEIDDVRFSNVNSFIISARACGNNMLRTNKYLVQEMVDGYGGAITVDGVLQQLHFFTVWDYTANAWATDGVTFDLEFFVNKTYYYSSATAQNGATIGN